MFVRNDNCYHAYVNWKGSKINNCQINTNPSSTMMVAGLKYALSHGLPSNIVSILALNSSIRRELAIRYMTDPRSMHTVSSQELCLLHRYFQQCLTHVHAPLGAVVIKSLLEAAVSPQLRIRLLQGNGESQ